MLLLCIIFFLAYTTFFNNCLDSVISGGGDLDVFYHLESVFVKFSVRESPIFISSGDFSLSELMDDGSSAASGWALKLDLLRGPTTTSLSIMSVSRFTC